MHVVAADWFIISKLWCVLLGDESFTAECHPWWIWDIIICRWIGNED